MDSEEDNSRQTQQARRTPNIPFSVNEALSFTQLHYCYSNGERKGPCKSKHSKALRQEESLWAAKIHFAHRDGEDYRRARDEPWNSRSSGE